MPALISKVGREDHNQDNNRVRKQGNEARLPIGTAFVTSKEENSVGSVGCDTYGFINNIIHGSIENTTGCLTRCNNMADIQNDESCTGIGCCKVDIPLATKNNNISIKANSFSNFNTSWGFNNCSYSFMAKKGGYEFSVSHLMKGASLERVPMVIDWSVGEQGREVSRQNIYRHICRGNSSCQDSNNGFGYRFRCNKGFEGNPYHLEGCRDNTHNCISEHHCRETEGSFECFCPAGESGDGKREGKGCHRSLVLTKGAIIGLGVGLLILIVGAFCIHLRVVAIKKFRELHQNLIEEFIDWLVLLEEIRHRNVVPILGYCLESEVPLLVYEFFNNGTLFDKLHKRNNINFSWKTRLQIAIEAATALDYLHSGTRIPIIHSNVSSANILLDDTYTAKLLLDFCTNVSLSSMHEIGLDLYYLDPEYIHTGQLTENSDVYSFGVVLAELIIGEKTIQVEKPEGGFPLLAKQFILTLEKNSWLDILETGIVNKENEDEFIQVALLAAKCLRLHAKERPSMGMVAMKLKNIREKHQIKHNSDLCLTKSLRLFDDDPSGTFEHGSSSTSSVQHSGYESCTDSMQDGLYSVI
ncbi:hypothetical protein HN51_027231 [Arachis hypogaea]|nr:Wall-associated receptor kinase [Arachis hypogaea]